MAASILLHLPAHPLVPRIRGAHSGSLVRLVRALHAGGNRAVESTINSPKVREGLKKVAAVLGKQRLVGTGTVPDPETARLVPSIPLVLTRGATSLMWL